MKGRRTFTVYIRLNVYAHSEEAASDLVKSDMVTIGYLSSVDGVREGADKYGDDPLKPDRRISELEERLAVIVDERDRLAIQCSRQAGEASPMTTASLRKQISAQGVHLAAHRDTIDGLVVEVETLERDVAELKRERDGMCVRANDAEAELRYHLEMLHEAESTVDDLRRDLEIMRDERDEAYDAQYGPKSP